MNYLYRISNLEFAYKGEVSVFKDLNMVIPQQGITVITGKNGSGKTTLCRLLTGLASGYRGSILLKDRKLAELNLSSIMGEILYIKQDLQGNLMGITPSEDLKIWQNRYIDTDTEEKGRLRKEALSKLGIEDLQDKPLWELSYGQKRRSMLSVLPLFFDKYWIIDEPTASLDEKGIELLVTLIEKKREKSAGVLILTHRPGLFLKVTDGSFSITDGKIAGES